MRDLADLTRRAGPDCTDLVARIAVQLDAVLPRCADPGMALANLERFMAAVPRIETTLAELAENPRTTEILLQVFSTSQYLTEVLIRDPELLDWLQGGPERRDRSALIDDLWNDRRRTARRRRAEARLAPVSSARESAHRLQRHRPRLSPGSDHPGPVGPGRRLRRGGRAAGPRSGRGSIRGADDRAGLCRSIRRAGAGKARRPGAQLQLRHRSGFPLR